MKISKRDNINQFIAFLKIIEPGTRPEPKSCLGFLCYFNKISFYCTLEHFEINGPSINEL